MTIAVKICGINTEAALDAALDSGADYLGLVFFPRSPRHISFETAAQLASRARGQASIVALTVDAGDAALAEIVARVEPDVLQLHGGESPERVREVGARFNLPTIKAIKVETRADAESARGYAGAASLILFDAKPSRAGALPGGNGLPFDWRVLDGIRDEVPFMLSGGLTPDNVTEAIRVTGASAVDVSSGVEVRPGEKGLELIRRFLRAAKTAKQPD